MHWFLSVPVNPTSWILIKTKISPQIRSLKTWNWDSESSILIIYKRLNLHIRYHCARILTSLIHNKEIQLPFSWKSGWQDQFLNMKFSLAFSAQKCTHWSCFLLLLVFRRNNSHYPLCLWLYSFSGKNDGKELI